MDASAASRSLLCVGYGLGFNLRKTAICRSCGRWSPNVHPAMELSIQMYPGPICSIATLRPHDCGGAALLVRFRSSCNGPWGPALRCILADLEAAVRGRTGGVTPVRRPRRHRASWTRWTGPRLFPEGRSGALTPTALGIEHEQRSKDSHPA
jgi:hypothetical protein